MGTGTYLFILILNELFIVIFISKYSLIILSQHGDEGQLSRAYAAELEKLPYVRYLIIYFKKPDLCVINQFIIETMEPCTSFL